LEAYNRAGQGSQFVRESAGKKFRVTGAGKKFIAARDIGQDQPSPAERKDVLGLLRSSPICLKNKSAVTSRKARRDFTGSVFEW
jgi:hypothetical protein